MDIYPWHESAWKHLGQMRSRMPHALLLYGRQGTGKLVFAQELARGLLCESPTSGGRACGTCSSCGWLEQGNHPDFRLIQPEETLEESGEGASQIAAVPASKKSRFIVIEQIRGLGEMVSLTSHRHGLRVVVLAPAEELNLNAANAVLKVLEEPPPATLFILVAHQLQRVLPTIRSRCLKVAMPAPSRPEAESWLASQGVKDPVAALAFSGGSPLEALAAESNLDSAESAKLLSMLGQGGQIDPLEISAHWGKSRYLEALTMMQRWCYDMLSARLAAGVRHFPARRASLQALGKSVDLALLLDFQHRLQEARRCALHPLNTELQLESLLVAYAQMFSGAAQT